MYQKIMLRHLWLLIAYLSAIVWFFPVQLFAAGEGDLHDPQTMASLLLVIAAILIGAKVFHIIERAKQPQVVGELIAGIVLGNLAMFGITAIDRYADHDVIYFLAEFGVIILLFQIGLESNIADLKKSGMQSIVAALIGAFTPFLLGTFVIGPVFLASESFLTHLFVGASLAATSVGITARIFKDLGLLKSRAATIVIGAAVIDDIIGLIILAVVSGLAMGAEITALSVSGVIFKSLGFLVGSIILGQLIAPWFSKIFSYVSTGTGTKFTVAISFSLLFAAFAKLLGLEPIIGAFAAGLVLDPVHFKFFKDPGIVQEVRVELAGVAKKKREVVEKLLNKYAQHSVEDTFEQLALFFVPIFFVVTGMGVKLDALFDLKILGLAVVISVIAFFGKFISGIFLKGPDRLTVGFAMVPRGEVGLIFAAVGKAMGVISDEIFSLIVAIVLITTIIGPFLLDRHLRKIKQTTTLAAV